MQSTAGPQPLPSGGTANLVEEDGELVVTAATTIDDGVVFALIDTGRR